jgi:hypothetical protein
VETPVRRELGNWTTKHNERTKDDSVQLCEIIESIVESKNLCGADKGKVPMGFVRYNIACHDAEHSHRVKEQDNPVQLHVLSSSLSRPLA